MKIRTYKDGNIELCPNINLKGQIYTHDDGCEYIETLTLYCKACEKEHNVEILIN